jgi:hypothetical protein
MSFFYDNALTTVTIPTYYSTTGPYAVNGSAAVNIGAIRSSINPDPSLSNLTGTYNYLMCMAKNNPVGPTTNNYLGVLKITQNGTIFSRETTISSFGADYAEYFESFDQNPIPIGTTVIVVNPDDYELVVVDENNSAPTGADLTVIQHLYNNPDYGFMFQKNGYVRPAATGDNPSDIVGIVRPQIGTKLPTIIGNSAWSEWQNKYMIDEFGIPKTENYYHLVWNENGVNYNYPFDQVPPNISVPSYATKSWNNSRGDPYTRAKINPYYSSVAKYKSRMHRQEWILVGLLGQMPMLEQQPMNPGWKKISKSSNNVLQVLVK